MLLDDPGHESLDLGEATNHLVREASLNEGNHFSKAVSTSFQRMVRTWGKHCLQRALLSVFVCYGCLIEGILAHIRTISVLDPMLFMRINMASNLLSTTKHG